MYASQSYILERFVSKIKKNATKKEINEKIAKQVSSSMIHFVFYAIHVHKLYNKIKKTFGMGTEKSQASKYKLVQC